ncbi:MAG TPA: cyclic nucleotide-binding domain-containing protein [Candidatus Limnocylindrales bacterium]|nr:cyclic nucleotide-binding domain-containing protein [Candidatus Limnocylindrales bacterium]
MNDSDRDIVDILAGLTLFGDLNRPQLEAVAHTFDEEWFSEGQRILRQGFTGTGFFVILEGEAAVRIDGVDRATLGKGDFFGEISILLGEPPVADIVALRPLRCLVLGGPDTEPFLNSYPRVMYRMLQAQARRLRNASQWRS